MFGWPYCLEAALNTDLLLLCTSIHLHACAQRESERQQEEEARARIRLAEAEEERRRAVSEGGFGRVAISLRMPCNVVLEP